MSQQCQPEARQLEILTSSVGDEHPYPTDDHSHSEMVMGFVTLESLMAVPQDLQVLPQYLLVLPTPLARSTLKVWAS